MGRTSRLQKALRPDVSGARSLTEQETDEFRIAWRRCFARKLDPKLSAESGKGFDWHTFSYNKTPHLAGDDARNAYRAKGAERELIVLPHSGEGSGFRTTDLPDFSGKSLDVYIFPEDLSWTMVFTHEDGWLGPYFATATTPSKRSAT